MAIETSYTNLRENLASVLDQVVDDQEIIVVRRRSKRHGSRDVALISATELASLMETAHLLSSPRNAERLMSALRAAERGEGTPMSIEELKRDVGLGEDR